MSLKIGFNNTSAGFKVLYLIKAIALFVLCRVHDFTRYKVCRTFSDLFYWPEGLCVDMLVIFSFFIIGALMMYDAFVFCDKCKIKIENKPENNIIIFPG
ncbi:MAG: hypothetical protein KBS96_02800 [Lachnospiraceae bacterium]|nr:hypothetical protein [Candidatus Colinaster scatohippi]